MADSFHVDAAQLERFATELRAQSRALRAEQRRELKRAGELIANDARAIAAQHSNKIAGTIRVRALGDSVVIEAGGKGVPEAYLLERGNRGRPLAPKFRHPVFGNQQVWVEQSKHPYLWPSVLAHREKVVGLIGEAIERTWQHAQPRG